MKSWSTLIACCFSIVFLLATCKKDTKTVPPVSYDVTGTWILTGFKSTYIDTVNVTSAQYPCLGQIKITYFTSGIVTSNYLGDSVCYVSPYVYSSSPVSIGRTSIGMPGEAPDTGSWKVSGILLTVKHPTSAKPSYGTLSLVNGKLQVIIKDTLNFTGGPYYVTSTQTKQ